MKISKAETECPMNFFNGSRSTMDVFTNILIPAWSESHRVYHSLDNHLIPLLNAIKKIDITGELAKELYMVAWFHDAVYIPGAKDNELKSAELFLSCVNVQNRETKDSVSKIFYTILGTGCYLDSMLFEKYNKLSSGLLNTFSELDLGNLLRGTLEELKTADNQLSKESKNGANFNLDVYNKGRINFVKKFYDIYKDKMAKSTREVFPCYIDFIEKQINMELKYAKN